MRGQGLPIVRQCELLDISRSSLYRKSGGMSPEDEEIMKKIDRVHMKYPFKGSRRMVYALGKMEGVECCLFRFIRTPESLFFSSSKQTLTRQ